MREYKFRGRRLGDGGWCSGYLVPKVIRRGITWWIVSNLTGSGYDGLEVDPATVGQFTGLHDKNGKEIYEGDIISSKKHPQIKHLIFYNEKEGKFMAGLYGKTNVYDFGVCGVDIPAWMAEKEVIGNIHDDSGLIENGGREDG